MMKNADYIMSLIIDPDGFAKKAQVGVDLSVKSINLIDESVNFSITYNDASIREGFKNAFGDYTPIVPLFENGHYLFRLEKGTYSIGFDQGLKALPATNTAFIWQRSTLGRNGALIRSAVYDPGFETPNIGAILTVSRRIYIELHARVAQIVIHENEPTELYNGQYLGAKDFR